MKNYYDIPLDEKLKLIKSCNNFYYYVNNISSCVGSPKWIGNALCDIVYWIEDAGDCIDPDVLAYYVEDTFFHNPQSCHIETFTLGISRVIENKERVKQYSDVIYSKYLS